MIESFERQTTRVVYESTLLHNLKKFLPEEPHKLANNRRPKKVKG